MTINTRQIFIQLLLTFFVTIAAGGTESKKTRVSSTGLKNYIVHVKRQVASLSTVSSEDLKAYHRSFLPFNIRLASSEKDEPLLYSYQNVVSSFAARLTDADIEAMSKRDGFVSAREERILKLQTTHTPKFLGLHQKSGSWKESEFGKGSIIGILDAGIIPNLLGLENSSIKH
ncbi:unnamed protein product [Lactuca virosa]|uniref:Inhibitor I9 domain-containing protein n=1 Tax=Lactuca virosa TaxID=75947 RepID=A0AAU9PU04_9ASTR|nr:unnamed protein product [Lactuca virosa]